MTWTEANVSLQLATEERVGSLMRENARAARAQEDAAFAALRGAVGGPG